MSLLTVAWISRTAGVQRLPGAARAARAATGSREALIKLAAEHYDDGSGGSPTEQHPELV